MNETTATLNVTYDGESQNLPTPIYADTSDEDVRRIASESLNITGVFAYFVVDRFPDTGMIYLRPKVPFGAKNKHKAPKLNTKKRRDAHLEAYYQAARMGVDWGGIKHLRALDLEAKLIRQQEPEEEPHDEER